MSDTINTISAEARKLFRQRDQLETKLQQLDAQLRTLRAQYMGEARVWGISNERFRHETQKKVSA